MFISERKGVQFVIMCSSRKSIEVAPKASTPLIDGVEGDQLQGQVKYNVVVMQEEESGDEQEVNVYEIEVFLKIISSSTWIFKWFTTTHI